MSEFKINVAAIDSEMQSLRLAKSELYLVKSELAVQIMKLRYTGDSSATYAIRNKLGLESRKIGNEITNINSIITSGKNICSVASTAERNASATFGNLINPRSVIRNQVNHNWRSIISGGKIIPIFADLSIMRFFVSNYKCGLTSPAYNVSQKGRYGGDQGSPIGRYNNRNKSTYDREYYEKIKKIIQKHHPLKLSDKQIKRYLEKLNLEGCSYVAVVNTIFADYEGREEEFEKTFGFPMYDEKGNLNLDLLLVDYYSDKDNKYTTKTGREIIDLDDALYALDEERIEERVKGKLNPRGTNEGDIENRWESYCREHGIDVDVRDVNDLDISQYDSISKKGEVICNMHDKVVMYQYDGTKYKRVVNESEAAHAVIVTGVREDGYLEVSSWGKRYYINPNEPGITFKYQQVIYK